MIRFVPRVPLTLVAHFPVKSGRTRGFDRSFCVVSCLKMAALTSSIGFLAGLLTTAADVPQVWKTYRTKSGDGLSFRMLIALALGLALWVVYGLLNKSLPLIVANGAGLALILALLGMKLKFDPAPTKD